MDEVETGRRESSAGFHFVHLYQDCPRKWFIKYVLGIMPKRVGKALIFGKAWHEAAALLYQGKTQMEILQRMHAELTGSKEEYKNESDLVTDLGRFQVMLSKWYEGMQERLGEYEIVAVEKELRPKLADGLFEMTIRPDAVLMHRDTKRYYIAEHKTTSYSLQGMISSVDGEDQVTAYSWGLTRAMPETANAFGGVLLDVTYQKGKVVDFAQQVIYRNRFDLEDFELAMIGLFNEMTSKVKSLKAGKLPPPLLFPRNGSCCSRWPCEYEAICRTRIRIEDVLGSDFIRDPLVNTEELLPPGLIQKGAITC